MRSTWLCGALVVGGCSGSADVLGVQGQPLDECQHGASTSCVRDNGNAGSKVCQPGDVGYVWGACDPAACTGSETSCTTAEGESGVAACVDGKTASPCGVVGDCHPGQNSAQCPGVACGLKGDTWAFSTCGTTSSTVVGTPLVVSFDGAGVAFTRAPGAFDLFGQETTVASRWVSASTPWLALDVDGNGNIDDGRELFGSMTKLPNGERASNGFLALAALDDDGDGWITAKDSSFERLVLWRDRDQDRRSSAAELSTMREAGIVGIALDYVTAARCENGDCEIERARFRFVDERGSEQRGEVIDVHFAAR